MKMEIIKEIKAECKLYKTEMYNGRKNNNPWCDAIALEDLNIILRRVERKLKMKNGVAEEKIAYKCMDYMENELKEIVERLMKQNEENLEHAEDEYEIGYIHGIHDGLLDLLNELNIKTDEEYYN